MPLNKVIFANNSQNNNTFLKKGTPEGPKPVEQNTNIPIVQSEQPVQEVAATASIAIPTIPIGSRPNVLRSNISKNEESAKYLTPTAPKNKYTSKLLNYIEPYEIGGVRKTAFYSEISTNFKVGERVFIINGNYDSHDKILNDKYSKGSDGYKVLAIVDCKVVLDIDYTGQNPYESPTDINDLIFVHNIDYQSGNYQANYSEPFDYINTFKTYITDATISGDLVSFFQGKVVSGVLRTWTGNIIFNKYTQFRNTTDVFPLNSHTGNYTPPSANKFFVRDSLSTPNAGDWIDVSDQIRTNKIRVMDQLSNPTNDIGNKRLFILGADFTWEGTTFQERQIYKFDDATSKWIIDRQYKTPIITATYFKYGKFLGVHNGGLFGSYLKLNNWNNATWNYGVMINTKWNNGFMNTITKVGEKVVKASLLYDQFLLPYVSQVIDTTNNSGLGYNLTIDSKILKGVFLQSTFENCDFPGSGSGDVIGNYYSKTNPNYDITANFSKFQFCDLYGVLISSSTLFDSIVRNSTVKRTKSVNSQIFKSVFDRGEFNSDSGIRVLGAELNSWDPNLGTFTDNTKLVGILKLFISDEDFFRMEKNDTFYIERVNKEFFLGSLNYDNRIILPYETKFLLNHYWDAEFSSSVGAKQAVSVRDKRSNRNRFYVSSSTNPTTIDRQVPNTNLINTITYWQDVTARFSQTNRISPGYDPNWTPTAADVTAGVWFYYLYEIPYYYAPIRTGGLGLILPPEGAEEPGNSIFGYGQTTHIYKYTSVPTSYPNPFSADGYLSAEPFELVFTNTVGPYEPLSPGQYRGEYVTNVVVDPILGNLNALPYFGANLYQVNDIVRFYNPELEKFEYYQCLVEHNPELTPDSYVTRTYTVGAANTKILISETSKYKNYCSIDIETSALGWYRDQQLGQDIYTFDRDQPAPTMPLKPKMDSLLPTKIVDKIFKNVLLKNSNFHSGVFVNSNWVSGSLIEDFDNTIYNKSNPVPGFAKLVMARHQSNPTTSNLKVYTNFFKLKGSSSWFNPAIKQLQLGDLVHTNSITYQSSTQVVQVESQFTYNGAFGIAGGATDVYVELGKPLWANVHPLDLITQNVAPPNSPLSTFLTDPSTYTIVGSETINYASLHRVIIENSTVFSGVFKRVYFKNTKLTNRLPYVKPSTLDIDPSFLPKVINTVFARNTCLVDNGFIYASHITNITNTGGYFYGCYWNGATFSNGEFQSGFWIDGSFLDGKFSDSNKLEHSNITTVNGFEGFYTVDDNINFSKKDPYISTINYFDIAKKPIRRIWNNGRFLGGEFYNSYWLQGTFSNGKFWRSRWFSGDFESGIFGDLSIKYEETNLGNGFYSPVPFNGVRWQPTVVGMFGFDYDFGFLGLTQSKFFGGVVQNGQIGGNGVVFWYGGQMLAGEFTSASASVNMQSIWYNGTFNGSIFSKYAQWKNGIFNSGKFISIYGYENQVGLTSYKDFANNPVFAWENGVFNGGEFGIGTYSNNPSWRKGDFTGGIFRGRIWYDGVFSGGIFMGSGEKNPYTGTYYNSGTPSQISSDIENEMYLSFRPLKDPSDSTTLGAYYGVWYNGVVTDKRYQYISNEKVKTKLKRAEITNNPRNKVTFENILWNDGLFDHENGTIKNSLFLRGTFSNGSFDGGVFNPFVSRYDDVTKSMSEFIISSDQSSGSFKFSDSLNLYNQFDGKSTIFIGQRTIYNNFVWEAIDVFIGSQVTPKPFDPIKFKLIQEISKINWNKGTFVTGSFYCSQWGNGIFKGGYISGAYWANGTFEYGTAENIFWDGGNWKNGNWNGTPFNYPIIATGPVNFGVDGYSHSVRTGRAKEIILQTDLHMKTNYQTDYKLSENGNSYLFLNNVFSASPTMETFGLTDLKAMELKGSEYHEIWLPYKIPQTTDPNFMTSTTTHPKAISWSTFLSENTVGLSFWISQQSYNFMTQSSLGGGLYRAAGWFQVRSSLVNADFEQAPNVAGSGYQPLAQIGPATLATLTTPQLFINHIQSFTWSDYFTHSASVYDFNGTSGVKIRFGYYKNNKRWTTFRPQPTIIAWGANWDGTTNTENNTFYHYILDLTKPLSERFGWVTSSFFNDEMNLPNPAKPVDNEKYEAKDYYQVNENSTGQNEENYRITSKPCSDWALSDRIPFFWTGRITGGVPEVIQKIGYKIDNGKRNFINLYTKFSNYPDDLPILPPLTAAQVNANPSGYNTFQKYLDSSIPYDNAISGSVVPPQSAPSLKIYPRYRTSTVYKAEAFYNRLDCARLIADINNTINATTYKPFNGVTGSRIGFYVNDKSQPQPGALIFSNNTSVTIPDAVDSSVGPFGMGRSTIVVSGAPSSIPTSKISVTINVTTTYTGDLRIALECPNGDRLSLTTNLGASGDNYTNTTFTDFGNGNITSGSPPYTGSFRPIGTNFTISYSTNPATSIPYSTNKISFSTIGNGLINPNGTWALRVFDTLRADLATIVSWSLNLDSTAGCSVQNGQGCLTRVYGFEVPLPTTTLSYSNMATDVQIDSLVQLLQTLRNTKTSGGTGDPNAFGDFAFFRVNYGGNTNNDGMAVQFELYGGYTWHDNTFEPVANLVPSTQGPNNTANEFEFKKLYYEGGGGSNLYLSPLNSETNTYDIIQYTTELEISVELEKEVSFDFFIGSTFSSYTLQSAECKTAKELNYFPKFYRIKMNYLTSLENIWSGVSVEEQFQLSTGQLDLSTDKDDSLRSWIRKTSFGILRIYSWRISKRKVEYNTDYNLKLYAGINHNSSYIGLPATPSVALSLPTDSNNDNSIMFGNGIFRQGIWENGVWNGGLRFNSNTLGYFNGDDVLKARDLIFVVRTTAKDTLWSIKIQLIDNLALYRLKLDVGSKISVSNLAAYDNNLRRIIISSLLEVESYSLEENTITVQYKSLTPISYIEKDSSNHLIYLTTNIWANGAFLNGMFRGVWNNGLFRGGPFLTKIIDSHFIDGAFEGGHFKSSELKEGISIYGKHNTGLIQNFKFKDMNNSSPNIRWESDTITDIRNSYKSWIDVVYSTYSVVNLKQDSTQVRTKVFLPAMRGNQLLDEDYFQSTPSGGTLASKPGVAPRWTSTVYNPPNLRGLPTVDVLTSTSELRDFLSTNKKVYQLGTKRKIYSNLLPDDGNFVKPIASNPTSSRVVSGNYTGLFPIYPALQNITTPFFASNTSQLSYGFTYSMLWQRAGSDYVTPGYIGSTPKTWVISQYGHGSLNFSPKSLEVTSGDIIKFRLNDLRDPALTWPYSYNTSGFQLVPANATGTKLKYVAITPNTNNSSMYPWNNYDKDLYDSIPAVPYQLYSANTNDMNAYGWNAYNPYGWGSPFGDAPIADNNGALGNRILLVRNYGAPMGRSDLLYGSNDDANGTLAWAYTDAGYAYPQERSINTSTGMRTTYTNGGVVVSWAQQPIKTNQSTGRTGPGLTTAAKTNGLTHGVHFYINANQIIRKQTDILTKYWNANAMSPYGPIQVANFKDEVGYWQNRLSGSGLNGLLRFNPTNFNPDLAYGKIIVKQAPGSPELGLAEVPFALFDYESNTNPNTDNILRLTISNYQDLPSPTAGPLQWVQLFQNKAIRPIPNRYYELSVDITYNLRSTPTYSAPTPYEFYQGLFLDDIYENLEQESRNQGLPEKNLHQYFNHFYTGVYEPVGKKFRVKSTEYFMNKNNVDLIFYNLYPNRGGPFSIDYNNISLNEVDMLPFFSYFSASIFDTDVYLKSDPSRNQGKSPYIPNQIDTAPMIPLQGVSPFKVDIKNNYTFADNSDLLISSKLISNLNKNVVDINILDSGNFINGVSSL